MSTFTEIPGVLQGIFKKRDHKQSIEENKSSTTDSSRIGSEKNYKNDNQNEKNKVEKCASEGLKLESKTTTGPQQFFLHQRRRSRSHPKYLDILNANLEEMYGKKVEKVDIMSYMPQTTTMKIQKLKQKTNTLQTLFTSKSKVSYDVNDKSFIHPTKSLF